MRTAFIQSLISHARRNPKVFLVVGDLGYSVVEPFAEEFPARFLNVGVAEQNMTGIAAGLAFEGHHVFTYSIANFPTLRCLEQIRNDVCYHQLPVTVVSVGAGFAYGNLGYSHHAVEDIAIMRALPHMRVFSPADPRETRRCVDAVVAHAGPSYLRIGKSGEDVLYPQISEDRIDVEHGPIKIREGDGSVAIVATGSILKIAIQAARVLEEFGVFATVFSCPCLKPVSDSCLSPLWLCQNVVTVEEHIRVGGLGCLVREHCPSGIRMSSLAVETNATTAAGSQDYLRARSGLTTARLVAVCREAVSN